MESIVLMGADHARLKYIENYIRDNNIKSYNIIRFGNKIKISDAREIKKTISIKIEEGEKRLIVLSGDITHEAQNALLKTLEEPPLDTTVIISATQKESLLPTIISRSKVVEVGSASNVEDACEFEKLVDQFLAARQDSLYSALLLSERVDSISNTNSIEKLIIVLRKMLLKSFVEKNIDERRLNLIFNILSNLSSLYPLVKNNNLNKRMAVENAALNALRSS